MNRSKFRIAFGGCLLAAIGATGVSAQSFAYHDQDLLIGFRQSGAPFSLLVDAGNVDTLVQTSLLSHQAIVIGNASALKTTFPNLGTLKFSGEAANRFTAGTPLNTLWITRTPDAITGIATPWTPQGSGTQGLTATRISSLGNGGVTAASITPTDVLADGVVRIGSGNNNTVGRWVGSTPSGNGPLGNFNGQFQGNAETTTAAVFGPGVTIHEDLFRIVPGSADSEWVASITLSSDGTLRFMAVPEPETYATIAGIGLAAFAFLRRRPVAKA